MKTIVNNFRTMELHDKALCIVYVLALLAVGLLIGMEKAHAQSGNIYTVPQAQVAGNVYQAVVLQVSIKEVEATTQMRVAGAGVGSAAGLLLASSSNSQHRFTANTVGVLLGGLLGERTANAVMRTHAQQILICYSLPPNGQPRTIAIVQPAPPDQVFAGESVFISEVWCTYRVLKRPL